MFRWTNEIAPLSPVLGLFGILCLVIDVSSVRADDLRPATTRAETDFFESKVRPILVERCLECHGSDKAESGLRLDSREGLLTGGELEGAAATLDEPEASPLLLAVRHELGDRRMPPVGKLSPDQIAILADWIRIGAPWGDNAPIGGSADRARDHWAFQPVVRPVPPPGSVTSPIDAFLTDRLKRAGLAASTAADRRTLVRRATFDLIGLPPDPATVEEFLADERSDSEAFARLVDGLLASPHYGERWGRHWLDVARYADSKGYVFQEERRYPYAYTYRDYVVRSFNEDRPYDRFLVEQLAADKLGLPEGDLALAAMGYLTVGRRFLNNPHDIIDDRIDVVARGMLGLTVACARCHDHKFDPIPTADYYSLHGVFASSMEPETGPLVNLTDNAPADRADYDRQLTERQTKRDGRREEIRTKIRNELRTKATSYLAAAIELEAGGDTRRAEDLARARDLEPARLRFLSTKMREAVDAAALDDPILGPWKALRALPSEAFAEQAPPLIAASRSAPIDPAIAELVFAEPTPSTFSIVAERYGQAIERAAAQPADPACSGGLRAWLDAEGSPFQPPIDVVGSRIVNRAERNELQEAQREVDALGATHPGAPARAMLLVDRPTPVNPYVFVRGNEGNHGPEVPRQFLAVLSGPDRRPFEDGSGRLGLARAIADPANPLTARVMVNRVWMHHFGRPLVATPSDFGLRSDPPSHPELLDWLAAEFVASGWSVKHLHRLMMNSAAYMQQSLDRPDAAAIDPENRLLWRQNRRRLEFEAMRDSLLDVAGRLDQKIGGRPGPDAADPATTRRTLYGFIDRQNLDGVYRTFDFASPDATSPGRHRTTVPQQALFLMNSPFAADNARALAARVEREAAAPIDSDAGLDALHRRLFGRTPTAAERELAHAFLSAPSDSVGSTLSRAEQYAQVLLLTNEFLYVD